MTKIPLLAFLAFLASCATTGRTWRVPALSPGTAYTYETSEKDPQFSKDTTALRFRSVTIDSIRDSGSRIPARITFEDGHGNRIVFPKVDLLQLVPRIERTDGLARGEAILEEFERFGFWYRADKGEVIAIPGPRATTSDSLALSRLWRPSIVNNCLSPRLWEMVLDARLFQDIDTNRTLATLLRQNRTIDHVWFQVPKPLYKFLWERRNPGRGYSVGLGYPILNWLAHRSDAVDVPPLRDTIPSEILEIGHRSGRWIVPLNREQELKDFYHLGLNRRRFHSFRDVLDQPVKLARFQGVGLYDSSNPVTFDYSWMRGLDTAWIGQEMSERPGRYARLTLSGPKSPYSIVFGNLDLASLHETQLYEMAFGFDPMPIARWNKSKRWELGYVLDTLPHLNKPWMMMLDSNGRWVNNLDLGVERLFVGWHDAERTTLQVYLICYERVIPIWMALVRVKPSRKFEGWVSNAKHSATPPPGKEIESPWSWSRHRADTLKDTFTIRFDSLRHDDALLAQHGYTVEADSFLFRSAGTPYSAPWRTLGSKGWPWPGETFLIPGSLEGFAILNHMRGRKFDLLSLDIEEFHRFAPTSVTFVGMRNDHTPVFALFQTDGRPGPQTFKLPPDFRNLEVVRWYGKGLQYGNFRVYDRERPR